MRRKIAASVISANRTKTLSTTGALAGDQIEVCIFDKDTHTIAFVNGGVGGGTLVTVPDRSALLLSGRLVFDFDGTNWSLASGILS